MEKPLKTLSISNAFLGIEVDIDVEHGGQRSKVTPTSANQEKTNAEATSSAPTQNVQTKADWNNTESATQVNVLAEQIQDMVVDPVPTQMEDGSFHSQVQELTVIEYNHLDTWWELWKY